MLGLSEAIKGVSEQLKKPTTFEEQLELLKSRGLEIKNDEEAISYLKRINYYFFTGYLLPYKDKESGCYIPVEFEKIKKIISFDIKLRNILLYCIEHLERSLKTNMAYYFAHNYEYGNVAYKYSCYFTDNPEKHRVLMEKMNENIKKNEDFIYIKHNLNKYQELPIWVCIELFTLGNLEHFYQILNKKTKDDIASLYLVPHNKLEKWISSIRYLRNLIAHYHRVYGANLKAPVKPKGVTLQTEKIFDYIVVIKELYLDLEDWNNYVIDSFDKLVLNYEADIDLSCIGFPKDWKEQLKKLP